MRFPTELRVIIDYKEKTLNDILNNNIVVNIKSNKNKEEKIMLENEKVSKLEQLNSLREEYANKLAELTAQDINSLIENEVAKVREQIEEDINAKQNVLIAKAEFKVEAIDEIIADVEAIEVEAPIEEAENDVEEAPIEATENDVNNETQF